MWTYLLLLLSVIVLIVVFFRRSYLVFKVKEVQPEVKEEENRPDKKRLKKGEKSEMEKLYNRAVVLIKAKNVDEAVKALVSALAINHDYLEAQKLLGMLYIDIQEWVKAAAIYKYLAEKSSDPVDFSHLGLCLYNAGEFEEAASAYQAAINLDPERPQRYISLSQVYKSAGKDQLALIAVNKAISFDPGNVEYWLLAADLNMILKNPLDARGALNKALELSPKSKIAVKMLEDLEKMEKEGKGE